MRLVRILPALALLATAAVASADGTGPAAERVRIGDHPAFVRVVVDFDGGTPDADDVEAIDPQPFDGTAALRVTHPGVHAHVASGTDEGVTVSVVEAAADRLRISVAGATRRFKYLSYAVVGGDRLAVDLWKSRPPSAAAEVLVGDDRCLTLGRAVIGERLVRAGGRERDLFEHGLSVRLRAAGGTVIGARNVIAAEGRWGARVPYRVRRFQAGTLEAVAASAKDGALDCLVQARVMLPPRS